ncbi:MAG: MaoC family dehydratase [Comamonas sp.]
MPSLKFTDIPLGHELPPFTTGPITRGTLALYAGASGDHNLVHIDSDFAQAAGMPDVFAHGMLSMAYLAQLLTNWTAQESIRDLRVRFSAITHLHERITCTGIVVEKNEAARTVRVEIRTANEAGETKLSGEAIVALDA